jgi:hypothetical protein
MARHPGCSRSGGRSSQHRDGKLVHPATPAAGQLDGDSRSLSVQFSPGLLRQFPGGRLVDRSQHVPRSDSHLCRFGVGDDVRNPPRRVRSIQADSEGPVTGDVDRIDGTGDSDAPVADVECEPELLEEGGAEERGGHGRIDVNARGDDSSDSATAESRSRITLAPKSISRRNGPLPLIVASRSGIARLPTMGTTTGAPCNSTSDGPRRISSMSAGSSCRAESATASPMKSKPLPMYRRLIGRSEERWVRLQRDVGEDVAAAPDGDAGPGATVAAIAGVHHERIFFT